MVKGPTHTNVIFDAVIPFDIGKSDDDILSSIEKIVKTLAPELYAVVNIDKSYV